MLLLFDIVYFKYLPKYFKTLFLKNYFSLPHLLSLMVNFNMDCQLSNQRYRETKAGTLVSFAMNDNHPKIS